ncbi:MAG: LamG domain-containing protein [Ruminococcaceae bacterium]|nr:LamG domain-containing protein [Oscillospiraceae bacterium]
MKKHSKRMLSLVLSVLMVVTMLPTFAFTASAYVSNLSYRHTMLDIGFTTTDGFSMARNGNSGTLTNSVNGISIPFYNYTGTQYPDINETRTYMNDGVIYTDNIANDLNTSDFSNANYNKNWEITYTFNYTSDGKADKVYPIKLKKSDGTFFGVRKDKGIYYGADGSATKLGDISTNFSTSNSNINVLTYAYNNGIVSIYVDGNLEFVKDMGSDTFFENISGFCLGGDTYNNNWTGFDSYSLVAESFQQDDANAHLKGRYLVSKNLTANTLTTGTDLAMAGSVSYKTIDGVPCAVFPNNKSSWLTLSASKIATLLSNCNESSGYTISFYGKSLNNANSRFFDMSTGSAWANGSSENYIFMAPNGWMRARTTKTAGSEYDFGDSSTSTDGFHTWTIAVKAGAITVYKDGEKQGSTTIQTYFSDKWIESMTSNANLFIGASCWNDDAFSGYIRDLRIYDIALNDAQAAAVATDTYANRQSSDSSAVISCSTLEEAISLFESRISLMATNGYDDMYTNISTAYEYYKEAKALVAAGNTDVTVLNGFNSALTAMQPFEEVTAANPDTVGGNLTKDSNYYNSVIYSEGMLANHTHGFSDDTKAIIYGSTNGGWKYGAHTYLYYPNTVLLYDGVNTPKVPVTVGFINTDGRFKVWIDSLVENQSEFSLNTNWQGYNDSTAFQWPSANDNTIGTNTSYKSGNPDNSNIKTIDNGESNPKTTYRLHKNALAFTPSTTPENAYNCYSSTTWDIRANYTWGTDHDNEIDVTLTNNDADIVIINYKKLTDKLKGVANDSVNKMYLSNLTTAYMNGGLEELFAAFDSATSLNPNTGSTYFKHTYDYAGADVNAGKEEPMDVAALLCGDDIDSSVNLLDTFEVNTNVVYYFQLKKSIAKYEKMMRELTSVKTNLEAAYKAYLVAVEYIDAYDFGKKRDFADPTLQGAYENLETAMASMSTFTAKTATSQGEIKYPGDSAAIDSSHYQNILYWGTTTGGFTSPDNNHTHPDANWTVYIYPKNSSEADVTYPNTVLMFDGTNTPKIPVCATTYKTSTDDRVMYYLYPTVAVNDKTQNSYFHMAENWRGNKPIDWGSKKPPAGNWSAQWNTAYAYDGRSNITNDNNSSTWISANIQGNRSWSFGNYYYASVAASTMDYLGDAPSTNIGGTAYPYAKHSNMSWVANLGSSYNDGNSNDYAWGTNSTTSIYVVNYEAVTDRIAALASDFESGFDVTQYREGGLGEWFASVDDLTSFNPNSYTYSGENYTLAGTNYTGTEGAVVHCAADIQSFVSANPSKTTDTKTSEPYDSSGNPIDYADATTPYQKLKIAILESRSAPTSQGCIKDETWIAYSGSNSSGLVLGGALPDAINAAANIANGKNGEYTGKSGYSVDVEEVADNLHNAIQDLKDYQNSEHNMKYSYKDNQTHRLYFQCNSDNSHELDADHHTVLAADGEAYDALGVIYKTLDLNKYTSEGKKEVNDGKTAYDNVVKAPTSDKINPSLSSALQSYVDAGVSSLLTSINTANVTADDYNNISLKFNVYTVNNKGVASDEPAYYDYDTYASVRYGSTAVFNAKDDAVYAALGSDFTKDPDNMGIVKWSLVADGKTREFTQKSETFTTFVQENATVNVYVTKMVPQSQLVINNLFGNKQYVLDVDDDTPVVISKDTVETITVDGIQYTVPNSLSYVVGGWQIGENVIADTTTSVNTTVGALKTEYGVSALTLRPVKIKNANISTASYTYTLNGVTVYDAVEYDKKITVSSPNQNVYALVIQDDEGKYIPVTYDKSYTFNASHSLDFYTLCWTENDGYYVDLNNNSSVDSGESITDFETKIFYNNQVPFIYSFNRIMGSDNGTDSEGNHYSNKWTTFSAFSKSNVTITECGTLRSTAAITQDDFVLDNVGKDGFSITKISNTKRLEYSNQYSYSLNSTSTNNPRTVVTRAYVKYRYTYLGKEIDAVSYGPMLVSYYGDPSLLP